MPRARRRGYTEFISVGRKWRRRGLARALIARSLRLLADEGMAEPGHAEILEVQGVPHRPEQRKDRDARVRREQEEHGPRRGALRRAVELGYTALALTDHNGLYGSMEFAQAAKALGLRAIHGAEVTLADGRHLTLLVRDATGWRSVSSSGFATTPPP